MMQSDNIINVSEADFEYEVLAYSQNIPVVVDFWATWCAPCRVLGPLLEKLAHEAQGNFRLAKVDVDQNPNLAERYQVRSVPSVKAFKEGKLVSEFSGAVPEPRLREFIQNIAPSPTSLLMNKAQSLLAQNQIKNAELTFRKVLEQNPGNSNALLGLAKCLLLQGKSDECMEIITQFPASKDYQSAELLRPLCEALVRLDRTPSYPDDPLQAAYENSLRLAKKGNIEASMDGLLDVIRQNKQFQNGEARKVFLSLLELLGADHPSARQYRNELASVLF